jgi:hypothetical protein
MLKRLADRYAYSAILHAVEEVKSAAAAADRSNQR